MVRRYVPERPVSRAAVTRFLELASRAPSAGFSQGWDFLVLTSTDDRERFWRLTADATTPADSWLEGMRTAPVLVVCLSDPERYLDRYAEPDKGWTDRDPSRWPVPYWDVDTGMAALVLQLAAVDDGLAGCFFGVPPERIPALRPRILDPGRPSPGRRRQPRVTPHPTVAPPRCGVVAVRWPRSRTTAGSAPLGRREPPWGGSLTDPGAGTGENEGPTSHQEHQEGTAGMAGPKTPPPGDYTERIVDVDVEQEMQGAFLEYAYSVIYSRALPDARDGLKPVQRRILYSWPRWAFGPTAAHVKCSRIVGDVMGKLHPHGDTAIYDALVRLAQDFTLRMPLVDGHGNFGSLDDGPAAYRYCVTGDTRIRLADGRSPADRRPGRPGAELRAPLDQDVLDRDGSPVRASMIFHSGSHPVISVQTDSGHQLRGSHNHPVLALCLVDQVPRLIWRRLDELRTGRGALPGPQRAGERRADRRGAPPRACSPAAWVEPGLGHLRTRGCRHHRPGVLHRGQRRPTPIWSAGRPGRASDRSSDRGATTHMLSASDMASFAAGPLRELIGVPATRLRIPEAVWCAGPGVKRAFLMAALEGDGSIVETRHHSVSIEYRTSEPGPGPRRPGAAAGVRRARAAHARTWCAPSTG